MKRWIFFILVIILQAGFLTGTILYKEWEVNTSPTVLLKIRPIDPLDPYMGNYLYLSYDISRLEVKNLTGLDSTFNEKKHHYDDEDSEYFGNKVDKNAYVYLEETTTPQCSYYVAKEVRAKPPVNSNIKYATGIFDRYNYIIDSTKVLYVFDSTTTYALSTKKFDSLNLYYPDGERFYVQQNKAKQLEQLLSDTENHQVFVEAALIKNKGLRVVNLMVDGKYYYPKK